jgi:hypothetical protein
MCFMPFTTPSDGERGCGVIGCGRNGALGSDRSRQKEFSMRNGQATCQQPRQYPWKQPTYLGNARAKYSGGLIRVHRVLPGRGMALVGCRPAEAAPFQRESGETPMVEARTLPVVLFWREHYVVRILCLTTSGHCPSMTCSSRGLPITIQCNVNFVSCIGESVD